YNIKKRDAFDNSYMIDKNLYDIVIVGGGITGSALACALDIGVWENIIQERIKPFKDMQVWDGISNARIRFNSDFIDKNVEAIAWIMENHNIQHAILTKLAQNKDSNVNFLENTKVERIMFDNIDYENEQFDLSDWPTLELSNGRILKARLLIGADGINSIVRSFANIESLGWDYNASAVVATLQVDPLVENIAAWQRFLPTGPIAMLPIKNGFSSMVWSTTPTLASKIRKLPSNNFVHLVNAAIHLRVADLEYLYSQLENNAIDFSKEFEWRQSVEKKAGIGNNPEEIFPPLILDIQEKSRAEFPLKMRNAETDVQSLVKVIEHGVITGQDLGNLQYIYV
ncbi:15903_t:CDS:2, partial [Racocetra fulgida]